MTPSHSEFGARRSTVENVMNLLRGRTTAVWFVLITATVLSYLVGTGHGIHSGSASSAVVLLFAFLKVRFVGLYFMEIRDAPMLLRTIYETYCLGVCLATIGMYWLA